LRIAGEGEEKEIQQPFAKTSRLPASLFAHLKEEMFSDRAGFVPRCNIKGGGKGKKKKRSRYGTLTKTPEQIPFTVRDQGRASVTAGKSWSGDWNGVLSKGGRSKTRRCRPNVMALKAGGDRVRSTVRRGYSDEIRPERREKGGRKKGAPRVNANVPPSGSVVVTGYPQGRGGKKEGRRKNSSTHLSNDEFLTKESALHGKVSVTWPIHYEKEEEKRREGLLDLSNSAGGEYKCSRRPMRGF